MGNMRLKNELLAALGAEAGTGLRYTVAFGRGAYFENVRRIEELGDSLVVLRGKKDFVRVEGANLSLDKYFEGDVALGGEVRSVTLVPQKAPRGEGK